MKYAANYYKILFITLLPNILITGCNIQNKNEGPSCTIINPSNNSIVEQGTELIVNVNANDPDGKIEQLQLYFNGNLNDILKEPPYSFKLSTNDIPPDNYTIKVTAEDDDGAVATDEVVITIGINRPQVDFVCTPTTVKSGISVLFIDKSTQHPSSWSWDFGDGYSSTEQSPSHSYSKPGVYNISLIAKNQYGTGILTKEKYITVVDNIPLIECLVMPVGIAAGKSVEFTNLTQYDPGLEWIWDFGDGSTSNENGYATINHVYNSPGVYSITLTANGYHESRSKTLLNYITVYEAGGQNDVIIFNTNRTYGTLIDVEGNSYRTIIIGTQTWMAENLRVTKYKNGIDIPDGYVTCSQITNPAYSWYLMNPDQYKNPYGALYNYNTISTNMLCPVDWHVPNIDEWSLLVDYLGGDAIAGSKLKETGFIHWNYPNTDASNESGFSAIPAGELNASCDGYYFRGIGDVSEWWSSTNFVELLYNAHTIYLNYNSGIVFKSGDVNLAQKSVRCIKD